ncbi:Transcription elongation factor GreA [Candidatus Kinetoplastibacterium sorsogonicusi]|uniref:Transcription elongation factor GreA n=1 Tax=Candidatus Kinetoplastidibacterium kentomonadis TaxID=1576550 RepID=A0A3S7J9D6_9PROT|nr:transcription elongation factor GreA [Candidatus Kinetoplastibacterium sorsogonicusi]AWD32280.1 Transcription elongation factor GreA [Candidatus Kinetoplastibacterium sorsogonicusi]
MSAIYLTVNGAERLKKELHHLKTIKRPEIINAISEARSHGDLSENAEYDVAREKQSFIEGRISELESILSNANIIDPKTLDAEDRIVFGAFIKIEEISSGEITSYQIVGNAESDIKSNLISVSSPLARALIGKRVGDIASVDAPSGIHEYEILEISYK